MLILYSSPLEGRGKVRVIVITLRLIQEFQGISPDDKIVYRLNKVANLKLFQGLSRETPCPYGTPL
jgi:hypothetical protein